MISWFIFCCLGDFSQQSLQISTKPKSYSFDVGSGCQRFQSILSMTMFFIVCLKKALECQFDEVSVMAVVLKQSEYLGK